MPTRRLDSDLAAAYAPNLERAWSAIDRNMNRAPDPQKVADTLVKIVAGKIRRPVGAVGHPAVLRFEGEGAACHSARMIRRG